MNFPKESYRKVNQIESLATLPHIASDILDILRTSNSSMKEISRVIERDISVTTKIIKVSNSPLWGYSGRIDNVQRALILLGLKEVTNIVIAVSLYSTFSKLQSTPNFDRETFWLHSAGTGQIARTLSKKIGINFQGEEFVAALIHDVGKMVLDQFFNEKFQDILSYAKESDKRIIDVEKEILGCTHTDIGGWLLKHWNFPKSIITAVTYHHAPERATKFQDLTAVIHLSEILCEMWGIGFDGDIKKVSLQDNSGWQILKQMYPQLYMLDMEKFTFELEADIEKAQLFLDLIRD